MIAPAIPDNEERRLQALRRLALLDSQAEERFDRITRIASGLFDVPITFVSLIDENRQWIKSCFGVDVQETSRDSSFCGHTILSGELLVIPDALLDPRFCDNPFVVGPPHIRFYAGCPLAVEDDLRVGTLCLLDTQPRNLEKEELNLLRNLAEIAREEMIKSERSGAPSEKEECLNFLLTSSDTGFFDGRPGSAICHLSPRLKAILGYDDDEPAHNYETLRKLIHHDDKMALPAIEPTNPGLTSFSREFRMLHKAGGWVWVESRGVVAADENGEPTRFLGLISDITEIKENKERLGQLELCLEHTTEGVLVVDAEMVPTDLSIILINPAFERLTGYSRTELMGKDPRVLRGMMMEETMFTNELFLQGEPFSSEAQVFRKDGSSFQAHWTISSLTDAQGQLTNLVILLHDVS